MAFCPITAWQIDGETVADFNFGGLQNPSRWWLQPWNKKMLTPWKKSYDQHRQHIKKQRHYFVNKGPCSQGYGFSSSHVWMWELDYKESWAPKNWCFWTMVLEKTLESPLDCKEIQLVNPKGNPSWIFISRTDVELQYFGHLMRRADSFEKTLIWERLKAGGEAYDRGWDGWHHRHNGRGFGGLWELVMDREALRAAVHGVAKSWTWLSDWTELNWVRKTLRPESDWCTKFYFTK